MDKLTASRITGGNTAYNRVQSDFYPTPPDVTYALIRFLENRFLIARGNTTIWEPACGDGDMADEFKRVGYKVLRSDIRYGTNFLTCEMPSDVDWIITNPPFSHADDFIRRCAEHKKPFALLLKSQYWHAKKRLDLFKYNRPAYVLPLTWRPDFLKKTRGNGSPLMDVMWVVWFSYSCATTIYEPIERPERKEED